MRISESRRVRRLAARSSVNLLQLIDIGGASAPIATLVFEAATYC